ncbi:MAG TPA: ATP-binding protein [Acidobacteriaceae bacterium]|nr:ATP-binding protein [Acidobacteriaceae bacterium]
MPALQKLENDAAPNLALPWVVRLRYAMVLGGGATLGGVAYFLGFYPALLWTTVPLVSVLATNVWLHRVASRSVRAPQTILGFIFLLDTVCLTAVLGLTGGPMNPFSLLYLVQITLAAVVLKKQWVWGLGVLASVCFGLLFVLHVSLKGSHLHSGEPGLSSHLAGMWIAFVIAAALISFFTSRVSNALRLREQEVLALQEHVARQERLTSLVTLAAGAAHELGTPLGTIAVVARELELYASTLENSDAVCDDAKLIRSEVERCEHILQRMSADGAEPVGESPRAIQIGELLRQTLREIPEPRRSQISIDADGAPTDLFLPVRATVQSLTALLSNALDAGSEARITLRAQSRGSEIVFSVCDHGSGMSNETLRRIAEPFFTTKEPGKGMGLGTFLVRTFAQRLGGELRYQSALGNGTTATLTLPVHFSKQDQSHRVST